MSTYTFTVTPDVVAPAGAPDVPLANIRPSMEPIGPIKAIMDQLTGTYDAYKKARIAQTWFDLYDANIFNKMDVLSLYGRNEHDCLMNWATSGVAMTNNGATFVAGEGMRLVSSELDYIITNFNPSTSPSPKYSLNSSCFGVLASVAPASSQYYIGTNQAGGGGVAHIQRTTTTIQGRINSATVTAYAGSPKQSGVVMINRQSSAKQRILLDGVLGLEADAASSSVPTAGFDVGKQGSTSPVYASMSCAGVMIGAGLTSQEESDLATIMLRHYNALI